ncbi:hypothetical protein FQN60_003357 [Etheostoma spectabile]|uniref:Uncharacterized protein n=1 Tax=Etheostoma spectabile TaxID=54343 RepID=A0A5J5CMB3_9PERO|nr:hypothetical protein FQN60_003357 [Etheostoma spectabile]
MAALIFPMGFYINEVGGQPYKLPNNTVVGSSYVLFVLSIFFTIVGLLFAGKRLMSGHGGTALLQLGHSRSHEEQYAGEELQAVGEPGQTQRPAEGAIIKRKFVSQSQNSVLRDHQ